MIISLVLSTLLLVCLCIILFENIHVNKVAYLIKEYWYDSSENRDCEGYKSLCIFFDKKTAETFVENGGMVPGKNKLVYSLHYYDFLHYPLSNKPIEGGYQDYSAKPTLEREMNPRYQIHELPLC
jgi:hypothetical protein